MSMRCICMYHPAYPVRLFLSPSWMAASEFCCTACERFDLRRGLDSKSHVCMHVNSVHLISIQFWTYLKVEIEYLWKLAITVSVGNPIVDARERWTPAWTGTTTSLRFDARVSQLSIRKPLRLKEEPPKFQIRTYSSSWILSRRK